MPINTAAWQTAPKVKPLEVKSAPYTSPRENEIVIKNVGGSLRNREDGSTRHVLEYLMEYMYCLNVSHDSTGFLQQGTLTPGLP